MTESRPYRRCREAYVLNLNYEWACTTGYHPRPGGAGMALYRTLDWPLRLGGAVVVGRHQTSHGPYLNVTWSQCHLAGFRRLADRDGAIAFCVRRSFSP
ncbi:MAG TPA: hypothetical protein VF920_10375 [Dongiaceae bacterium]